ncbi:FAD linked oxidase [Planococcus antarcticus DSM 14505]|uniref:FAD linked oxidase n=1 Tax=Planococcus antarcticus DSM 14505 TaxID=1185653 RepID=A0A1C7DJJ8_9BACL|nr:FAD-linked oxidase C-terminal domain-containing protein [Planococcus antarcticus]ANU11769.1 hypothetical protein BBH88_16690 [Planococcus antarcticus DSM 14505]EIM06373.1 FAD linked oxidase [Planococcus antarcticus DSM 14505]
MNGDVVRHVGDGSYYVLLMIDGKDPVEMARSGKFDQYIGDYVLARGGSITIMQALSKTLNPHHLLNPGKFFQVT